MATPYESSIDDVSSIAAQQRSGQCVSIWIEHLHLKMEASIWDGTIDFYYKFSQNLQRPFLKFILPFSLSLSHPTSLNFWYLNTHCFFPSREKHTHSTIAFINAFPVSFHFLFFFWICFYFVDKKSSRAHQTPCDHVIMWFYGFRCFYFEFKLERR